MALVNSSGTSVASYSYDPYGRVTSSTGTLATTNPLRYRGYYQDTETGFYYLQSRYYDPAICRFINADVYASTGQGILGHNMYAYCGNNPLSRTDTEGKFWSEFLEYLMSLLSEIGDDVANAAPEYAACGGAALVDGPLPIGDALAVVGFGLLTIVIAGKNIYSFAQTKSISIAKTEAIAETIAVENEYDPVLFPINPYEFNPVGLVMAPRIGSKNGALISWMNPITNEEVFRWDENPNYPNGSHYHIHGISPKDHYYAGELVPEPYASIYFPME